ncbi:MoxR family ATPase [Phragmitibacter flavus]|uniref:MoxR family ATPase n=1 Tax=Phragmitibacter flavus TaxID=2576071 RepID=A0A5R8KIN0_9BACT|nr:MoxR family ATPase [Phragmitibacter flavus]TLD72110.1 MoxR family ATPase [Phragmitibacter flavus]
MDTAETTSPGTPAVTSQQIEAASSWVEPLRAEIARVLVGQNQLVDRMLIALLTNGHVLLEGVPGLAKTLTVRTLAACLHGRFQRIQFTPDLLPADVVGTMIYNPREGNFSPRLGPIFANLVLADEINRAPAKVQSALLEAMQERQVTIGETTYTLPNPFMVMATQNPIDQEGTYTLPEAQLDRFLLKVKVDYPTPEEEREVLERMATSKPKLDVEPVMQITQIASSRALVNGIHLDDKVKDYIVSIIQATRHPERIAPHLKNLIRCGASPRGTINLALAAKANAFLQSRDYVIPYDVKSLAPDILRHRILLSYEAEAEGVTTEDIVEQLLDKVEVP